MISTLRLRNVVQDITMDDVFTSLRTHSLTMPETALCFKWWLSLASNRSYDASLLQRLKDVLMLSVEGSSPADTTVYPLSSFTHFLNHKVIALDMPLPQSTLPFALTRSFATADLSRVFGFKELDLETWTKYVVSPALSGAGAKSETNILLSPPFAEKVCHLPPSSPTILTDLCRFSTHSRNPGSSSVHPSNPPSSPSSLPSPSSPLRKDPRNPLNRTLPTTISSMIFQPSSCHQV
jgi:hypothetical protein